MINIAVALYTIYDEGTFHCSRVCGMPEICPIARNGHGNFQEPDFFLKQI